MPYDFDTRRQGPRTSLRAAVIDLMSHNETACMDEGELRAALRSLVADARRPADDLWDSYRGGRPDARSRVFATYGY